MRGVRNGSGIAHDGKLDAPRRAGGGCGELPVNLLEAENALKELADAFLQRQFLNFNTDLKFAKTAKPEVVPEAPTVNLEAKYRALVEQIPAVVFMAYLDKGIGEAYVSPQIEAALGFSHGEWLEPSGRRCTFFSSIAN